MSYRNTAYRVEAALSAALAGLTSGRGIERIRKPASKVSELRRQSLKKLDPVLARNIGYLAADGARYIGATFSAFSKEAIARQIYAYEGNWKILQDYRRSCEFSYES